MAENTIRRLAMFTMFSGKSTLNFQLSAKNYPLITVFIENKDNGNRSHINAPLSGKLLYLFINNLKDVALSKEPVKHEIDCHVRYKNDDGSFKEKELVSTLIFGKGDDGEVWIGVIAKDKPKIKFMFSVGEFYKLRKNNEALTAKEASSMQALSVANGLEKVYSNLLTDYNPNNSNNTNYSKPGPKPSPKDVEDDDIPF